MDMVAKGVTTIQNHLGPWSVQDMSLALAAMAKVTERQQPQAPGKAAEELAKDASFLAQAQHWRAHAEAIYGQSTAEWSLETNLPESSIVAVEWCPCNERLRPAYCISLDAPHGAVVVAVRGTSDITDMLVNAGASPEPFQGGHAHAGFVHASQRLLEEVEPHIEKAMEVMSQVQGEQRQQQQQQSPPRLVLVGHSLGCAVACMLALSLRAKYPGLRVWGLGPPACMSLELAQECAEFATCFIANHDLVPRFSVHTVENLRTRVMEFDWDAAKEVVKDDEDFQKLSRAGEALERVRAAQEQASARLAGLRDTVADSVPGQLKQVPSAGWDTVRGVPGQVGDLLEGDSESPGLASTAGSVREPWAGAAGAAGSIAGDGAGYNADTSARGRQGQAQAQAQPRQQGGSSGEADGAGEAGPLRRSGGATLRSGGLNGVDVEEVEVGGTMKTRVRMRTGQTLSLTVEPQRGSALEELASADGEARNGAGVTHRNGPARSQAQLLQDDKRREGDARESRGREGSKAADEHSHYQRGDEKHGGRSTEHHEDSEEGRAGHQQSGERSRGGGEEGEEGGEEAEEEGDEGTPPVSLHPPGRLIVLWSDPAGCGKMPQSRSDVPKQRSFGTFPNFDEAQGLRWSMTEATQEDLGEIVVSPWCTSDHMMGVVCEGLYYFQQRAGPIFSHN